MIRSPRLDQIAVAGFPPSTTRHRIGTVRLNPPRTRRGLARWLLPLILFAGLTGCATAPLKGRPDLLEFLVDGTTTRETVLLQLGQPSGRFEQEKILTYRLGYEEKTKRCWIVERENDRTGWPTWLRAQYSLVLVFDGQGVLRKHSRVEVN